MDGKVEVLCGLVEYGRWPQVEKNLKNTEDSLK